MILPAIIAAAQNLADRLKASCPSAKMVIEDGEVRVEIDRNEAMQAEYSGQSLVTRAIMDAGGRPA